MDSKNQNNWISASIAIAIAFIGILWALWSTSLSFYNVWTEAETYNHGFMIFPISLWLVWQVRHELLKVTPRTSFSILLLFSASTVLWMLAYITGVQVVEQFAMVAMLITVSMAIIGWQLSLYLAFPLLFLFFAVPLGEDLVPPMMEYTATFTVTALELTGIPVYRDGMWFSLPTGNWSVVEACSGVRYIIASVTLGFLYAYVSYHTLWKRIAFIILSAILPIIANGIRAYMIVMIGHLSDMELATGVDHLIYGWVFFGLVMLLLFWIGGFWQEEHPSINVKQHTQADVKNGASRYFLIAALSVVIAFSARMMVSSDEIKTHSSNVALQTPTGINGWLLSKEKSLWEPGLLETQYRISAVYEKAGNQIAVFVALYPNQHQHYEAVSFDNAIIGSERKRQQEYFLPPAKLNGDLLPETMNQAVVTQALSSFRTNSTLVWQWYRIGGTAFAGTYQSKTYEAWARIVEGRTDGAWIAVSTRTDPDDHGAAKKQLKQFMIDMYPSIDSAIEQSIRIAE